MSNEVYYNLKVENRFKIFFFFLLSKNLYLLSVFTSYTYCIKINATLTLDR